MDLSPALISVFFGLSLQYDGGTQPSVALNAAGVAVEVHKSEVQGKLWYHVGATNACSITWGTSHSYDDGVTPSVALNDQKVVVEVHETQNPASTKLYYHVGVVDPNAQTIRWGSSHDYDTGKRPSVALNNQGVVVEVHETDSPFNNKMWYRVGRVQGDTIKWGSGHDYDSGKTPHVALNDNGLVVEVHKSEGHDVMYSHVGRVNGDRIDWKPSQKYQDGVQPSAALTQDGTVVEVHNSEGVSPALWQMMGKVQGDQIAWSAASNFDSGSVPSVATNGTWAVQVHQSELLPTLWSSNSLLTDRANWMGDRFEALKDRPLRKLALPATHDAGMYAGNILGRTQDQNLHGQLSMGVRYFDLRPGKNMKIAHGIVDGPPVQEVLDDVKRYMAEGHRELAILKFSHYGDGFDVESYRKLTGMITATLGPWLAPKTWTGRLADAPLGSLIGGGGRLLVVCDGSFPKDVPIPGIYVYRDWDSSDPQAGDLTVFDQYANTISYDDMKKNQLDKFAGFNGKCKNDPAVPCDLFLLSWTLTPPTGVLEVSKAANRNLGAVMAGLGPNGGGFMTNLLYVDAFEYARVADVAIEANGKK